MQNYFNYFTEIETRFQARRGTLLLLSTLDWALIETWREAGVPLEAVLRGIDTAFDKYDARRTRARRRAQKINGLAWCSQSVMLAAEEAQEALVGSRPALTPQDSGFEGERIALYLQTNARTLRQSTAGGSLPTSIDAIAIRLESLASELTTAASQPQQNTEELESTLTALEARLFATLTLAAPEDELQNLREQASRELAAYRGNMSAVQLRQVTEQFVHKRLLQTAGLPRLSLFYMDL